MSACRATLRQCAIGEPSAAAVVRRVNRRAHLRHAGGAVHLPVLRYPRSSTPTCSGNVPRRPRAGACCSAQRASTVPELLSLWAASRSDSTPGPIFDTPAYTEGEVQLPRTGDLLALYTDGNFTEATRFRGGGDSAATDLAGGDC